MVNGSQIRLARAVLRWGVRDLAREAKVSPATIVRIEKGEPANATTLSAVRQVLEAADIQFTVKSIRRGPQARTLQAISDLANESRDHAGLVGTINHAIDECLDDYWNEAGKKSDNQVQQLLRLLGVKARWAAEAGEVLTQKHFEHASKQLEHRVKRSKKNGKR